MKFFANLSQYFAVITVAGLAWSIIQIFVHVTIRYFASHGDGYHVIFELFVVILLGKGHN